jgi:hypothetical protein
VSDPLFGRSMAITVNDFRFTALDAAFTVHKSIKPEPNTCELTIWNLNPEHQAQLEAIAPKGSAPATQGIPCEIEAGYQTKSLIWRGDLRTVVTTDDGPNAVTYLTSGDGEKAWKHARLHVSYGPKTPIDTSLRAMARALGVGEGNLSKVVSKLKLAGAASWQTGKVLSGAVARDLVALARSAELEVSVQDGSLQFTDLGKALDGTALKLNSASGLIGSPTVDNEGIVSFRVLMIPGLRIGGAVVLDAKRVKGNYRIIQGDWSGDTSGNDWFVDCQGEPL